jgi:predicted ATPase
LLKLLPDTLERAQQELRLQIALGVPMIDIKGYTAPEVENIYTRARELCQQIEEIPQLFPVLAGLLGFYTNRGQLQVARELAEQLLRLAQRVQDPALLLEAHFALGAVLVSQGEFVLARGHLDQGIALYDPQQHRSHAFRYGLDPGIACHCYMALTLSRLGYPDQAQQKISEALTLAQQLAHPRSLAIARYFFVRLLYDVGRDLWLVHRGV